MIELALIGIGMGSREHMTRAAERALAAADLILIPQKGSEKADLADLRRAICAEVAPAVRRVEIEMPRRDLAAPSYLAGVDDWHDAIAVRWSAALGAHLPGGGRAALLVWGDPSLYDSSLRIGARLRAAGRDVTLRVVPGVTSLQMLTAAFAIPVNTLGAAFLVTTGRRLRSDGWPAGVDSVAVMLDGDCAFQSLDPDGVTIWWGAYLGMARQVLRTGPLAETGPQIVSLRATERAAHGWIMDTYILRRGPA